MYKVRVWSEIGGEWVTVSESKLLATLTHAIIDKVTGCYKIKPYA